MPAWLSMLLAAIGIVVLSAAFWRVAIKRMRAAADPESMHPGTPAFDRIGKRVARLTWERDEAREVARGMLAADLEQNDARRIARKRALIGAIKRWPR